MVEVSKFGSEAIEFESEVLCKILGTKKLKIRIPTILVLSK